MSDPQHHNHADHAEDACEEQMRPNTQGPIAHNPRVRSIISETLQIPKGFGTTASPYQASWSKSERPRDGRRGRSNLTNRKGSRPKGRSGVAKGIRSHWDCFLEDANDRRTVFTAKLIVLYLSVAIIVFLIASAAVGKWAPAQIVEKAQYAAQVEQVQLLASEHSGEMGAAQSWPENAYDGRADGQKMSRLSLTGSLREIARDANWKGPGSESDGDGDAQSTAGDDDAVPSAVDGEGSDAESQMQLFSEMVGEDLTSAVGEMLSQMFDAFDANMGAALDGDGREADVSESDFVDRGRSVVSDDNDQGDGDATPELVRRTAWIGIADRFDSDGADPANIEYDENAVPMDSDAGAISDTEGDEESYQRDYGLQIPVVLDSGCTGDNILKYREEAAYVPDYHKQILMDYGWTFMLTNDDLKEKMQEVPEAYEDENLCGLCSSITNTIYVRDSASCIERAVVHEFGHMIDYMMGHLHATPEFTQAWEADGERFSEICPYQHMSEDDEKFAEAYRFYYKWPNLMYDEVPHLYAYFDNTL